MKRKSLVLLVLVLIVLTACSCAKKPDASQTQAADETKAASGAQTETKAAEDPGKGIDTAAGAQDKFTFAFDRDNFPVMDGSTATVPLGKAVASVLLGETPDQVEDLVSFNKTTQSFRNLYEGSCDILIVGEPNKAVFEEMEDNGFKYELEEIATDALIFVVNKNNPVDSLTTEQIRDIYAGKIRNWKEVGGNDEEIIPFQRNSGAGSQALMLKHVMKNTPLTDAPTELVAGEMGDLMEAVRSYDNSANAIGYSVYYYANDMKKADGLKIIAVDGVEPDPDTIRSRKYPHLNAYYGVIAETEAQDSPARIMYNWLMSRDGQQLIASEGYVAAENADELPRELPDGNIVKVDYTYYEKIGLPENIYTRLAEGELKELKASEDYGHLYPYIGSRLYSGDDGYDYVSGNLLGFFDDNARLVTDPVYVGIANLTMYDHVTSTEENLPFWVMSRTKGREGLTEEDDEYWDNMIYTFASMDGSFVCDKWYKYVNGFEDRIICKREGKRNEFDIYDFDGNLILTSEKIEACNTGLADDFEELSYGDGYYTVGTKWGEYYYADETGKTVLGPYHSANDFVMGHAVVWDYQKGDSYNSQGVIDKDGTWLAEPICQSVTMLYDGGFITRNPDDSNDIYSKDGKLILENAIAGYISPTNYGFILEKQNDNGFYCCDYEANVIFESTDDEGWKFAGLDGVVYQNVGAGLKMKNIMTGEQKYLEGMEELHPMYRMNDTPNVARLCAENSFYDMDADEMYWHVKLIDPDLNVLMENDSFLNIIKDDFTGGWYFACSQGTEYVDYYDFDLNKLFTARYVSNIVDGKFIVTDDYACTCYDKSGNAVFRYSLINSADD